MRRKISLIGAGSVGGACAQRLAERNYADLVLLDIVPGRAEGKALDIYQSGPVLGFDSSVIGVTDDYEATADSDVLIISAGVPRNPEIKSRDDLLFINQKIVESVAKKAAQYSPNSIMIVITNPLDAMVQLAWHASGLPRNRVIGMSGVLDTARFRTFVAMELGVSIEDVFAYVLGGHGDTMVPLVRLTTVGGIPITDLMPPERINAIVERTRNGGGELVKLLKTMSTFTAPSAAVCSMVDAILLDKKRIMPAATYLNGEYGIKGLFMGVPVKLGMYGVEQVIQIKLTPEEEEALHASAANIRGLIDKMNLQ